MELLHTTSINGLNSIRLSLAKQIENLENTDEWVASPVSQAKLDNFKVAKETVNLIIGYKRFQQEIAETNNEYVGPSPTSPTKFNIIHYEKLQTL